VVWAEFRLFSTASDQQALPDRNQAKNQELRRTSMRCNHCRSEMQQTDSITEGRARQTWYLCPLCAASQTISQPCQTGSQRIGNAQRWSSVWPESPDIRQILY